jgi:hypothetical protein
MSTRQKLLLYRKNGIVVDLSYSEILRSQWKCTGMQEMKIKRGRAVQVGLKSDR